MGKVYCGLDAGSSTCHLVALDEQGVEIFRRQIETSEASVIDAIESIPGEKHVHIEASELTPWLRRILKPRVARVVVSHPTENAWIANDSQKSDGRDGYKLAEMLRNKSPLKEVYYSDDEYRLAFKDVVRHYDDVTDMETRLKFKIKAHLRGQGVIVKNESAYSEEGRQRYLARVKSPAVRETIRHLYMLMDFTLVVQKKAKQLMLREGKQFSEVALLDGAPGVGPVGASQFVGYVQDPHRFSSSRKLIRYCRLGITNRSSDGKMIGRQSLDRAGVGCLKSMTHSSFLGAMKSKQTNLFQRTYHACVARTRNETHARLTTQRKIVAVLRAMWKGGTPYRDNQG
jgi:transposase